MGDEHLLSVIRLQPPASVLRVCACEVLVARDWGLVRATRTCTGGGRSRWSLGELVAKLGKQVAFEGTVLLQEEVAH